MFNSDTSTCSKNIFLSTKLFRIIVSHMLSADGLIKTAAFRDNSAFLCFLHFV